MLVPMADVTHDSDHGRPAQPTTHGIAAAALLGVVLVAPQLVRGWLTALALIALVVAGIDVVRAIVNREAPHPD